MRKLPIFVAFLILSASSLGRVLSYDWVDTRDYVLSSKAPIFSETFLAGHRAPLFPLLLKIVDRNLDWLYGVQVALAVFAFSFLTWVLWSSVRHRAARVALTATVLGLGLSSQVACWNYAPLSESISNSLSIVLIAQAVLLTRRWTWARAGGILAVATLWVATRDANAFELLAVTAAILVAVCFRLPRRNLVFAGSFVAMFLVASYSSDRGKRWEHASLNLLVHRVLVDEQATRWFTDRGMPVTPLLLQQKQRSVNEGIFWHAPQLKPFADWWRPNARRTWATFLATHPIYVLRPLFTDTREMYGQNMEVYESAGFHSTWRAVVSWVMYPESWGLLILLVAAVASVVWRKRTWWRAPEHWLPAALVLLGLAMGLFNQHCDAREVARHATHTNLHLRLGLWLLLVQSLDSLLE